jgi:hypothetical protein
MEAAVKPNSWQHLADTFKESFPSVGKNAIVTGGRKYKGKQGVIVRHQSDAYYSLRYKTEASLILMQMQGTKGYIVMLRCDDGSTFWVKADQVKIIL